jgi:S1-C subfamily serine protease
VAAAVGAASTFFGLQHSGVNTTSTVLTTAQVANRIDPGLVDIDTVLGYAQEEAAGTGMVLNSTGLVLTNNHVIEGATQIQATDIGNGQTYKAKVIGYDRSHDVALIQLENASGLQTVNLGSSSTAATGEKVVAIGNAEGRGGTPSVVTGHILGLNAHITASDASAGTSEKLTGLIKHNAPIEPGDSGGPLVNTAGQVIGIDTAASTSDFEFQGGTSQTQGFAIPINEALSIAKEIQAGTSSAEVHVGGTGFVGVEVDSAQQAEAQGIKANAGALVAGIITGSPAGKAGLSAGDLITSVNGQHVTSSLSLQAALQQHHPGDKVTIGWTTQSGKHQTATVTLTAGPAG